MYRAVSTILGERRRQPWRIWQASSGAGRDDGEKEKIPSPSPSASTRRERCHDISCSSSTTHAASGRSRSPGGRIRPGTRRRQAGARLKKEEAGGKKLGGLEHSAHAVLATSSPVRHQAIITTAAQRPPGRLRTRISSPPFEDFGESS